MSALGRYEASALPPRLFANPMEASSDPRLDCRGRRAKAPSASCGIARVVCREGTLLERAIEWPRPEIAGSDPLHQGRASLLPRFIFAIRIPKNPSGADPRREDKWFFYFEEPDLFAHLSRTGQPVYRVTFELNDGEAYVTEALCVAEVIAKTSGDYEAALLDFLISNLLLGEQKPFPVPTRAKDKSAGLLHHVIFGTGYREVFSEQSADRRRWWQFWRL